MTEPEDTPRYVYAASQDEAQRLLDESYLRKYRALPEQELVRLWCALIAMSGLAGGLLGALIALWLA